MEPKEIDERVRAGLSTLYGEFGSQDIARALTAMSHVAATALAVPYGQIRSDCGPEVAREWLLTALMAANRQLTAAGRKVRIIVVVEE